VTFENLESFFSDTEHALGGPLSLIFDPDLVVNMDETMVLPGHIRVKVLCGASTPRPSVEELEKQDHFTLVIAVAASGKALPSHLILPRQTAPNLPEEVRCSFYLSGTSKGWLTAEVFRHWVEQILIPFIRERRAQLRPGVSTRALLIMDNATQHGAAEELLAKENITVLRLPPHTSHILQPLDLSVFGPLKQVLAHKRRALQERITGVSERDFLLIALTETLPGVLTPWTIKSGFIQAGLFPWKPDAWHTSPFVIRTQQTLPAKRPEADRSRGEAIFEVSHPSSLSTLTPVENPPSQGQKAPPALP